MAIVPKSESPKLQREQLNAFIPRERALSTAPKWEIRLGFFQLLLTWIVIAAVLVAVFVFGLIAGQEGGLKQALEEQAKQIVRMPVDGMLNDRQSLNTEAANVDSADSSKSSPIQLAMRSTLNEEKLSLLEREPVNFDKANLAPTPSIKSLSAGQFNKTQETSPPLGISGKSIQEVDGFATESGSIAARKPQEETPEQAVAALKLSPTKGTSSKPSQTERLPVAAEIGKTDYDSNIVSKSEPPSKTEQAKASPEVISKQSEPAKPLEQKTTTTSSPGWYIQMAAERTNPKAMKLSSKLRSKGFVTQIQDARVKNVSYFRVLVGPFKERSQAEVALTKIKRLSLASGEPFLKRIQ